MFDSFKKLSSAFQLFRRLRQQEDFKVLLSHPKIQELLEDPEFREAVNSKNFTKLLTHAKFLSLMKDPEIASLLSQIKPPKN